MRTEREVRARIRALESSPLYRAESRGNIPYAINIELAALQ